MATCDGCGKSRNDLRSCGRDANGDPDAPDLCFLCRTEGGRRKRWSTKAKAYVPVEVDDEDLTVGRFA